MVKSFMFASRQTSPSNRHRRLHRLNSNHGHPERSEGSAFLSLVAPRRSPLATASLTPFLATLAASSQLTENPATLSPFAATLTRRVKPNPFVCHSYKKHPGVGVPRQVFALSCSSIFSVNSALSVPSAFNFHAVESLFSLFRRNREELNPSLSISSALFQKESSHNSFLINTFRTLSQNTQGWFSSPPSPLEFFAHPYSLTPIDSNSCKKQGGGSVVRTPSLPRYFVTSSLRALSVLCASALSFLFTNHPRASRTHGTNSSLPRLHRCGGKFYA